MCYFHLYVRQEMQDNAYQLFLYFFLLQFTDDEMLLEIHRHL